MELLLSPVARSRVEAALVELLGARGPLWFGQDIEELVGLPPRCTAVLFVDSGVPGFPVGLELVRVLADPGCAAPALYVDMASAEMTRLIQWLAYALSVRLGGSALCEATGLGPGTGACWSIVWERGRAFLADDAEVDADPPGPPVIVRELALDGRALAPG